MACGCSFKTRGRAPQDGRPTYACTQNRCIDTHAQRPGDCIDATVKLKLYTDSWPIYFNHQEINDELGRYKSIYHSGSSMVCFKLSQFFKSSKVEFFHNGSKLKTCAQISYRGRPQKCQNLQGGRKRSVSHPGVTI